MGICFDIDLTTTSHTFLQCRFWSRLLVQPLDCQQNHLFISLPLRCRKFQGVPWELRQCPSLQTWGNMLKPLTPWKIHEKTMKRTESNQQALTVSCCKFIQMQKGIPSFVQAQCTISWLHIGDKIASTFLVSHLTFISKLCGFNISRQKNWKLRNWGILWLRKTQWDPEVVTGNAGNGQQVAPRVEIPTKSLRSKLQGTAMLQHRFQGHLLGWWRWCSRGDFGWWPVDPWKICKFIEWKFRDMFVVIGNHRFNMFQFIS